MKREEEIDNAKTIFYEMDFRGHCRRVRCIYNDGGRCDMWDDICIPENVFKCKNYEEN